MKIRIISDIHFASGINGSLPIKKSAFYHYYNKMLKHDEECVTLVAGDMATGLEYTQAFLEGFFPNERVVFVEGNHLVYQDGHKTIYELQNELRESYPKTHLFHTYLENDWTFISKNNDVAVIGSTFFTNYEYNNMTLEDYNKRQEAYNTWINMYLGDNKTYEPASELTNEMILKENMMLASESLNDFRWGWETPSSRLTPNLYLELHNKAKEEVKRCYDEIVQINPDCKIILLTHHCLSPKCIDEKYKNSKLNASYVSDLEDWVNEFDNIKLVISGHVHCRKDFTFGNNKRYIVNAMGYCIYEEPFKENDVKFNPNLIIDTNDL